MADKYAGYFTYYLDQVPQGLDLFTALSENKKEIEALIDSFSTEQLDYAYDSGKWTIRQLMQHIIDTDRIFYYRALRFSRGDQTALEGFNENEWADAMVDSAFAKAQLLEEFSTTRAASISMFNGFTDEQLKLDGVAGGNLLNVEMLGKLMVGHSNHHIKVLKERYGI